MDMLAYLGQSCTRVEPVAQRERTRSGDPDVVSNTQTGCGQLCTGGVPPAGESDNAVFYADIRDIRDQSVRRMKEGICRIYVKGRRDSTA